MNIKRFWNSFAILPPGGENAKFSQNAVPPGDRAIGP